MAQYLARGKHPSEALKGNHEDLALLAASVESVNTEQAG